MNPTPLEIEEQQRVEEAMQSYRQADYRRDELRDGFVRLIFWTVVFVSIGAGAVLWILHHR